MPAGLDKFSFAKIAGLPSAERHRLIQEQLPVLRTRMHHLQRRDGVPFQIIHPEGGMTEVSHAYLRRECEALFEMGYTIGGRYTGIMLPHEAAEAADAYLSILRRGRTL